MDNGSSIDTIQLQSYSQDIGIQWIANDVDRMIWNCLKSMGLQVISGPVDGNFNGDNEVSTAKLVAFQFSDKSTWQVDT